MPTEVVTWHLARNYDNSVSEDVEKAVVAYLRPIPKCSFGDTEDNDDKSIKIVNISTKK
jgi:hypothetical protein